ncbi:MAG: hypothetical protein QXT84_03820 [Candidatus Bathyarchaeia archaeon]
MSRLNDKGLIGRVIKDLPSELRDAYEGAPRRGSRAHELVRLYTALYMLREGYTDISFEKVVETGNGEPIYVDIFARDGDYNVYVECERYPAKDRIERRAGAIKSRDNFAKVIVALQDRCGWYSRLLSRAANDIWIVCRNGEVMYPGSWESERRRTLYMSIHEAALICALADYREAEKIYGEARARAVEEEVFWRPLVDRALATVLGGSNEWALNVPIRGVWRQRAEEAERRLLECKAEVLGRAIPVLNAILALASPYQIAVDEDGSLKFSIDWEAWEWLGWKDYPCSENNVHLKLLEKVLRRELKIVAEILEFERDGRIPEEYKVDMYMARLELLAKKIDATEEILKHLKTILKQD